MANGLTPAVLNKQPLGLLGFLGIKNGGTYPQQLIPALSPTWDLLQLYSAAHATQVDATTLAAPAVGLQATTIVVPQQEIWYCDWINATGVAGAGEAISFQIAIQPAVNNRLTISEVVTCAANNTIAAFARQVWLQPGDTVSINVISITAAADVACSARRIILPI